MPTAERPGAARGPAGGRAGGGQGCDGKREPAAAAVASAAPCAAPQTNASAARRWPARPRARRASPLTRCGGGGGAQAAAIASGGTLPAEPSSHALQLEINQNMMSKPTVNKTRCCNHIRALPAGIWSGRAAGGCVCGGGVPAGGCGAAGLQRHRVCIWTDGLRQGGSGCCMAAQGAAVQPAGSELRSQGACSTCHHATVLRHSCRLQV